MKKSLRFISLILAAVFLIAGSATLVCYADNEDVTPAEDPVTPAEDPVTPAEDPVTPAEDPVTPAENPDSGNSGSGSNSGEQTGGNTGYDTDYDPDYSGGYVEEPEQYYDPDPLYYGDASNYSYNVESNDEPVGSVSSNTTLYNSSGMSAADAAPNEWSDITLDEKTVKTGVSDFSAIKSNTETQDNGDWILYLGYVLLALAGLGILYFIVATIAARKAMKKAERMERRRSSSPARSTAARMEEQERRASGSYHRTSHFADEAPSYSRRASSKADTGEVYVPRRAAKR